MIKVVNNIKNKINNNRKLINTLILNNIKQIWIILLQKFSKINNNFLYKIYYSKIQIIMIHKILIFQWIILH